MLIFVYGADTFRSRQKVRELVAAFKKKFDPAGLNVIKTNAADVELGEIISAGSSLGLFATRRLVLVEGLLALKKPTDEIVRALERQASETVFIALDDLAADKAAAHPVTKHFAERPATEVVAYVFNPLAPRELRTWLSAELSRRVMQLEPRALELLLALGNDLWNLSSALDKLAAYAAGRPVLARDVELLVRRPVDENIFACMDAVANRDLPQAATQIRAERNAGVEDAQLFTMLIRQFRLLLTVKSYDETGRTASAAIARELGLHPFVAGKLAAQARGFTVSDLRARFDRLFSLERDIKTGRLTHEAAVDVFLSSLATS